MANRSAINFVESLYSRVDKQVRDIVDTYPDKVDSFAINIQFDGTGAALTAGQKGQVEIPSTVRVVGARMFVGKDDTASSATVNVWYSAMVDYPGSLIPLEGTGILPTLSTDITVELDITDWNTLINRRDLMAYELATFVGAAQHLTLSLLCRKTGD